MFIRSRIARDIVNSTVLKAVSILCGKKMILTVLFITGSPGLSTTKMIKENGWDPLTAALVATARAGTIS